MAVIVILAIIALIAVPVILGIINDSKKEAEKRSKENYIMAAKQAILRYQMNNSNVKVSGRCNVNADANLECPNISNPILIEVEGNRPEEGGWIEFGDDGQVIKYSITMSGEEKESTSTITLTFSEIIDIILSNEGVLNLGNDIIFDGNSKLVESEMSALEVECNYEGNANWCRENDTYNSSNFEEFNGSYIEGYIFYVLGSDYSEINFVMSDFLEIDEPTTEAINNLKQKYEGLSFTFKVKSAPKFSDNYSTAYISSDPGVGTKVYFLPSGYSLLYEVESGKVYGALKYIKRDNSVYGASIYTECREDDGCKKEICGSNHPECYGDFYYITEGSKDYKIEYKILENGSKINNHVAPDGSDRDDTLTNVPDDKYEDNLQIINLDNGKKIFNNAVYFYSVKDYLIIRDSNVYYFNLSTPVSSVDGIKDSISNDGKTISYNEKNYTLVE